MERSTVYTLLALGLIVCLAMTAGCVGRGKRGGAKQPPAATKAPPAPATSDAPAATTAPAATETPADMPTEPVTEDDLDLTGIDELDVVSGDDTDLEIPEIPEDDLEIPDMDFGAEDSIDVGNLE